MITIPGKIPITIRPLFWLIAAFIGWMTTFTWSGTLLAVLVIFYSVLFHELGHALTGLAFAQKVRIELAAFGGFTYREGRKLKLREEFLVVLNGPLAGFLLGLFAFWVYQNTKITNDSLLFILKFTAYANFFWTIMNLVPLLPLDGGHLLSIIMEGLFGYRGVKASIVIGLSIGLILCIFFFIIGAFLLGALFLILCFESMRSFRYYRLMSDKDRVDTYQELLRSAEADLEKGEIEKGLQKFQSIREKTKKGILFTISSQEMARIYRHQGKYQEAYEILYPMKKSLTGEMLTLLHILAYETGDYKTAIEVGDQSFQNSPSYEIALINALSYAALKKAEPSIGWLECAMREGLPSLKTSLEKKEFAFISSSAEFQKFINTVSEK